MDNPQPQSEPTITLPLKEFLAILWGYKWKAEMSDYRERAYPSDTIVEALEKQIPSEVAARYFKIVRPRPSVDVVVWEIGEWNRSGAKEVEAKVASEKFIASSDGLTEWLLANIPFMRLQEREFVRAFAFSIVKDNTYDSLKNFGLTDEKIVSLREGKYE